MEPEGCLPVYDLLLASISRVLDKGKVEVEPHTWWPKADLAKRSQLLYNSRRGISYFT